MNNFKKLYSNKYRCETAPSITSSELNSFSKKEEFLFSHKSSLETLLSVIKIAQISFLSNLSKENKNNNKNIKEVLIELKENLNSMYKQQNAKNSFLESQLSKQKSLIQNKIFEISKNNVIFQNLKSEIEQLRILNFKAENDIRFIHNLIMSNYSINEYLNKNIAKHREKNITFLKPKFYSNVTLILHREDVEAKNYFKNTVQKKQQQDEQISFILNKIDQLKLVIYNKQNNYNDYIYAEDIIPEESKEYSQSVNINNLNKTLIKIIKNKNKINKINIDNDDNESEKSSLSSVNKQNKEEKNYINLNMNINLNFNFDKNCNIIDNIKYNSDRGIKNNDKKSLRLKQKRSFLSTDNLPNSNINYINEEIKSSRNNIEKEDYFNHQNRTVISKDISPEKYLGTI